LSVGIPVGIGGGGGTRGGAVRGCEVGFVWVLLVTKGASLWSSKVLTDARIASRVGPAVWDSC